MTKRQKTLAAVFLVGLAALVVDRTLLRPQGGPAPASAGPSQPAVESVLPAGNVPAPEESVPPLGLVERLDSLSSKDSRDFSQVRNAFALPESWFGDAAVDTKAVLGPVAQFISSHRLEAVAVNGGDSYILIDDRFLKLGKQIDGFTLIAVSDGAAVFERDGEQVRLELTSK